jgi:hypothetical protein
MMGQENKNANQKRFSVRRLRDEISLKKLKKRVKINDEK